MAQWRKAQYHLAPEHQAFAQLLQAPQAEAKEVVGKRFPVPKVVDCDYQGSQVGAGLSPIMGFWLQTHCSNLLADPS